MIGLVGNNIIESKKLAVVIVHVHELKRWIVKKKKKKEKIKKEVEGIEQRQSVVVGGGGQA